VPRWTIIAATIKPVKAQPMVQNRLTIDP